MKQLIVDISNEGEIKIEAVGFHGKGCHKATEAIETALGKVRAKQDKPEALSMATQKAGAR